jgi:hypothetical protein
MIIFQVVPALLTPPVDVDVEGEAAEVAGEVVVVVLLWTSYLMTRMA